MREDPGQSSARLGPGAGPRFGRFELSGEWEGRGVGPLLDQGHQPALCLGIAVDVALRCLNRAMASEELHIPQATAGQSDLAGRLGNEAASS